MCCVVGFVGAEKSQHYVLTGLSRLEYRGYDSAGFACMTDTGSMSVAKVVGGVDQLVERVREQQMDGYSAIGHTRWSTHGVVSVANAHPVFDCHALCAVVHNGIISREYALRTHLLQKGHIFSSDTDSELIAHLFEEQITSGQQRDPQQILHAVATQLEGAYAFVALMQQFPHLLFVARRRSPLCIARGMDGFFVVSDPIACAGNAQSVLFLPDESYALVSKDSYVVYSYTGTQLSLVEIPLALGWEEDSKQGYAHYMLKEIYEQREVLSRIALQVPAEIQKFLDSSLGSQCVQANELLMIGCGTSLHAAQVVSYYFEALCGMATATISAAEFRDRTYLSHEARFCCALSQSGETADTLEAMRFLQAQQVPVLAIVNRALSSMTREANAHLLLHAQNEVSVASTKTFSAHIAVLYLLAYEIAVRRGTRTREQADAAPLHVLHAAVQVQEAIARHVEYIDHDLAPRIAQLNHCFFIGRGLGYYIAQEGALKLKELAYIFAEAHHAGELKHGPLALIEEGLPVIVCSTLEPQPYEKLVANVREVRSRKGWVIALAFEGQDELIAAADVALIVPRTQDLLLAPLSMIGLLYYLTYRIADVLKRPIDKPRNLAKSVTVE